MGWANLTSGLIGSLIGGALSIAATLVALAHTGRMERQRDRARIEERNLDARQGAVQRLCSVMQSLEVEMRAFPLLRGRSVAALLDGSINFAIVTYRSHPAVCEWLLEQNSGYAERIRHWHRYWWWPLGASRRAGRPAELLGQILAVLAAWHAGTINDEAFADSSSTPVQVLRTSGPERI